MMLIISLIIRKGRREHGRRQEQGQGHDRRRAGSYYNIIHYNIIHYNIIHYITYLIFVFVLFVSQAAATRTPTSMSSLSSTPMGARRG